MLERRRPDIYGLPVQQAFGKFFWKGMFAGLLVVTFVAGAMILSDGMALHGLALHGSEIAKLGLLWLAQTSSSESAKNTRFAVMRCSRSGAAPVSGRPP